MSDGQIVSNGHQVMWDGKTVWVNSGIDGSCIGRFGKVGMDVNLPETEQMETGARSLESFRDQTMEGWGKFCGLMHKHYGVTVPTAARPRWLGITAREIVEVQPMTGTDGPSLPYTVVVDETTQAEYPPDALIERREIKWVDCPTCKGKGTDPRKRKRRCPEMMCRNGQVPDGDPCCSCVCHDKPGIMHVMPCCEWSGLQRRA